jgi:hypothetical protein
MTSTIYADAISFFNAYQNRRNKFMLLSVALILVVGMFMGWLCRKIKLPALLGALAIDSTYKKLLKRENR